MTGDWLDATVTLRAGMPHWPDNPPLRVEPILSIAGGDPANVSELHLGTHTGTHMDAPRHFVADGAGMDAMPLQATLGPARVLGIGDPVAAGRDELEAHDPRPGERLLLRTRNSERAWWEEDFDPDFVYLAAEGAALLVERGVRTVGVDYLSVGGFHRDGPETHHALLDAGVWVIEGLDLTNVRPGSYELCCLPLKLADGDGAPARALLRAA